MDKQEIKMEYSIDRTKCILPQGYTLWKVTGTYGRPFSVYVSAQTEKEAKNEFKETYDYLKPKVLSVEAIESDTNIVYDCRKMLILGRLNIIEKIKLIEPDEEEQEIYDDNDIEK